MKVTVTIALATLAFSCTAPRHADEHIARRTSGVEQPTTISIEFTGFVNCPGSYFLPAGTRLVDAVSQAGGFHEDAYTKGVQIRRKNGKSYVYDLRRVVSGTEGDPVLFDGDFIDVPMLLRPMHFRE